MRGESKELRLEELDNWGPVRKFVYGGELGLMMMTMVMMAMCAKKSKNIPKLSPIHIELQFAQM